MATHWRTSDVDVHVRGQKNDPAWSRLTAFEQRVLELFASGLPRAEIARAVNRAPKTISNSLTAAKDKLGARSLTEAAVVLSTEATGKLL